MFRGERGRRTPVTVEQINTREAKIIAALSERDMTVKEVADLCGVSVQCARLQLDRLNIRGLVYVRSYAVGKFVCCKEALWRAGYGELRVKKNEDLELGLPKIVWRSAGDYVIVPPKKDKLSQAFFGGGK